MCHRMMERGEVIFFSFVQLSFSQCWDSLCWEIPSCGARCLLTQGGRELDSDEKNQGAALSVWLSEHCCHHWSAATG